jgi:small-conductance mechanosensitive channel
LTANWSEILRTSAASVSLDANPSTQPVDSYIEEEVEEVAEASAEVEAPMVSKQLVVDLQMRLEQALTRVEALEAKLDEQSSGLRGDLEDLRSRTKATEAKVEKVEAKPQGKIEASAMPPLPDWSFPFPGGAFPDSSVRQPVANERVNPARATLHLRRPFDFEEFRRAQSQGLQNERLRVLVPPDPMSPLRKQ